MGLYNDCYSQVKSVLEDQKMPFTPKTKGGKKEVGMALSRKLGIFFDFFHRESLSKEQMLALRLTLHIPILVFGTFC